MSTTFADGPGTNRNQVLYDLGRLPLRRKAKVEQIKLDRSREPNKKRPGGRFVKLAKR